MGWSRLHLPSQRLSSHNPLDLHGGDVVLNDGPARQEHGASQCAQDRVQMVYEDIHTRDCLDDEVKRDRNLGKPRECPHGGPELIERESPRSAFIKASV